MAHVFLLAWILSGDTSARRWYLILSVRQFQYHGRSASHRTSKYIATVELGHLKFTNFEYSPLGSAVLWQASDGSRHNGRLERPTAKLASLHREGVDASAVRCRLP